MALTLADLTDPSAVLAAMAEYDTVGRDAFLSKYGFHRARSYFLVHEGKRYDSKAISGVALGYQHPGRGPLSGADFVGGDATVRPKLESLGFTVVSETTALSGIPEYFSEVLDEGAVYPREALASAYSITDRTLYTGIFQPKGSRSIWLFVTLRKTADRTQYADRLEGDILHWEGQTSGRSDSRIVHHEESGTELLLFYRDSKTQHPHAGFTYEGQFRYLTHEPGHPSKFTLQRISAIALEQTYAASTFDPTDVEDGRKKVLANVARRQGQPRFRRELMIAYGGQCAITGCPVEAVLEAAHIHPYKGDHTNHPTNGLLLRADLHTLFDLRLLWVDADDFVKVSERLKGTPYWELCGRKLRAPLPSCRPSSKALEWHRERATAREQE